MNTGSSLFLTPNSVLTIGATAGLSGAILATDNVTINNGLITSGANGDVLLYVNSGKTLTLNSAITGSSTYAAFVKSGTGTAVLNRPVLANGHYVINQGTVKLGAGNNTLWGFNQANSYLLMWDGTLDLNGTSQMTGALYQQNSPSPSAAVITSTNGAANLFINAPDARDYSGVITGPVGLAYGNTTATSLTLWADNTYTGPTLVYGGILQLAGNAKLSGTSSVELSYGALYLNSNADGGIGGGGALVNDRIPDAAPITMRAGRLYIYGRNWNDTQENLGVVTLAEGGSDFHVLPVTPGGTYSVKLVLADLQHSTDATLNIQGSPGILNTRQILVTAWENNMSGVMVNNIIPGWIGIGGNELASYIPGLGLSPITTAGYAGYDNAAAAFFPANSAASATQNIKLAGTTTVPLGGLTLNSVNTSTGTGNILFSNSSDLLSLTAGTLMKPAGNATYIGFFPGSGRLTSLLPAASGVSPLYVHSHAQAYTINSSIVDNGATPVRAVFTVYNSGSITLASSTNSYTGGTVINGWGPSGGSGALTLGAGAYLPAGGLTLSSADFTQKLGGVIDPANVITANAAGTINLVGTNTLAGLVFNTRGGWAYKSGSQAGATAENFMTLNVGTKLTLTGGITTTSVDPASFAFMQGVSSTSMATPASPSTSAPRRSTAKSSTTITATCRSTRRSRTAAC